MTNCIILRRYLMSHIHNLNDEHTKLYSTRYCIFCIDYNRGGTQCVEVCIFMYHIQWCMIQYYFSVQFYIKYKSAWYKIRLFAFMYHMQCYQILVVSSYQICNRYNTEFFISCWKGYVFVSNITFAILHCSLWVI